MPTLSWIGKEKVINHHLDVPFYTLKETYTFNSESSKNMVIKGDNLIALKALLPKYINSIDCVYIDPPYNTGNENWIYNDNVNDPVIAKWIGDVVGKEDEDLSRHDKWLCMMYPRLKLIQKLLKNDSGILFISIDEHEIANLLVICQEIFGKKNVEILVWRKNGKQGNTKKILRFKNTHEYIVVCYADKNSKRIGKCKLLPNWKHEQTNADNDPRGKWASGVISRDENNSDPLSENYYSILTPTGKTITREFYMSKKELELLMKDNRIYFPKGGDGVPRLKIFEKEEQFYYFDSIIDEMGTFTDARDELEKILGEEGKNFPTPKPLKIIKELIRASTPKNGIVLDAFAGSGTTGHAVLDLNKEDGGKRQFIMIELMDYAETLVAQRCKNAINGVNGVRKTDGDFSFYELGDKIFTDDNTINENVDFETLKQFVYYTETKQIISHNENNKYYLGTCNNTDYYLYCEFGKNTILDFKFLGKLVRKAGSYVIYADSCLLSDEELLKYNIVFKKLPMGIQRI